jgi:hypothetical protein
MATGVVWQVVATIRRVCLRRRGKDYKEPEPPRRADVENAKSGAGYTYSATDDQRGISFANGPAMAHAPKKPGLFGRELTASNTFAVIVAMSLSGLLCLLQMKCEVRSEGSRFHGLQPMQRIELTPDGRGFRFADDKVVADFREMKQLGACVVRIHLQVGRFLPVPDRPCPQALGTLRRLLDLAAETGLYLDLTGLGCYHRRDTPAWYDALPEAQRWAIQVRFWEAVAQTCAGHPAVWCYDLMNEPVIPGSKKVIGRMVRARVRRKVFCSVPHA